MPEEAVEEYRAQIQLTRMGWGRDNPAYRQMFTSQFIPEATPEQARWFNELQRNSTSPENAAQFQTEFGKIDVQDLLPQVRVPTIVFHAQGDKVVPFEAGRRVAAGIPGARFVPLDGENHILLRDEPAWPRFLTEARRFIGVKEELLMELRSAMGGSLEGRATSAGRSEKKTAREGLAGLSRASASTPYLVSAAGDYVWYQY